MNEEISPELMFGVRCDTGEHRPGLVSSFISQSFSSSVRNVMCTGKTLASFGKLEYYAALA